MNKNFIFSDCWFRIQKSTNIKNLTELADIIGISQPSVSRKKKEKIFPRNWAIIVGYEYNINPEWIMTGEESKRIVDPKSKHINSYFQELEEWGKEIGKSNNIEWLTQQIDEALPMFVKWKKRKEEGENNNPEIPKSKIA
jgi:hypothetical protein